MKYFDKMYFKEVNKVSRNEMSEFTDEILLLAKKYCWYRKPKLEINDDGILVNKYLYSNRIFTWVTLEELI